MRLHNLKKGDLSPALRTGETTTKENLQPITQHCQKLLYGFREGCSFQDGLFWIIEQKHKTVDKSGKFVTVLIDLSKDDGCIPHYLLLANLEAYRFK